MTTASHQTRPADHEPNPAVMSRHALEERLGEITAQLKAAHAELNTTNSELLQMALELEDRVAERTAALLKSNKALQEAKIKLKAHAKDLELTVAKRTAKLSERTAELQVANAALSESEERFRQMADNASEVFWLADVKCTQILYVSPAYKQIWGRTRRDLYKNTWPWLDAIHPGDRERVSQIYHSTRPSKRSFRVEYRVVRPDGSVRWISDQCTPVRNGAGIVYRIAGVAQDITEQKRMEKEILEVSENEQKRLGQELHDDLGQQLTGLSMLSMFLAKSLKMEGSSHAVEAADLARMLGHTILGSRNLAKGFYPIELERGGLIMALLDLTERITAQTRISCEFRHDGSFQTTKDKEIHLFRIAQEAINNAIKHGKPGRILVECTSVNGESRLQITDDGAGFKPPEPGKAGMGLHLLQYRAHVVGAKIKVAKGDVGGCQVTCSLENQESGGCH